MRRHLHHNKRAGDDRGVTLIIVAISLLALLGVGGLAIDGGRAYLLRRQMQNAADAASLDATKTLDNVNTAGTGWDTIRTTAAARAVSNGGQLVLCKLVPFGWTPNAGFSATTTPDCPLTNSKPTGTFAGVYVTVTQTESTFLVQVVGAHNTYTSTGTATAQVGKPTFSGDSPFAICGTQVSNDGTQQIMTYSGTTATVNPLAIGKTFYIYGPQHNKQTGASCKLPSSKWKGLIQQPGNYQIPGDWNTDNGDKAGPTRNLVNDANACGSTYPCTVAVPLCPRQSTTGGQMLYCTDFGLFSIPSAPGNSIPAATFLGKVDLAGTGGITGPPDPNGARRVVLTD